MARVEKRERMAAMLRKWRRSGQSAAAFAREQGINAQRLSYWKRVLAGKSRPNRRSGPAIGSLVPVQLLASASASSGCLEIHLASGERVVFPEGCSVAVLREVMSLLRERC